MTAPRLFAIVVIYVGTIVAWSVLGGSVVQRTGEFDQRLSDEVAQLWGGRHNQIAPEAWCEVSRTLVEEVEAKDLDGRTTKQQVTRTVVDRVPVPLEASQVAVDMHLDQRQKGLLWYSTYAVGFKGRYRFRDPVGGRRVFVSFGFPSSQAIYDGFGFRLNGEEARMPGDLSKGVVASVDAGAVGEALVEVAYRSRGLGEWTYAMSAAGVAQVRDFNFDLDTDFRGIDFPPGTLSPTTKTETPLGFRLGWHFDSLVTGQKVGVAPPQRVNPGPLASRITFFAPVGLLFFFTVMVMLGVVNGQSLHPMNYFFLAAAFFAFHLLLAYLVDHLSLHASFAVASLTSVFLVVTYLRTVAGLRRTVAQAAIAQLVFLVLFSYAFFFEGYAGLTVAIGAVVTLFALMQLTARVEWAQVFARRVEARAESRPLTGC
jgi:inner membrane protein involved in colicin E2 resistance